MSVKAITPAVLPGSGHLRYWRDLDGVDIDRDESVSAAFFDEYGLPPVHPMRRGYRPPLSSAIGLADQREVADPSPRTSSPAALGPLSKEQHA